MEDEKAIEVRLPAKMHGKLEEIAKRRGRSVEAQILVCIRNLVEDWEDREA